MRLHSDIITYKVGDRPDLVARNILKFWLKNAYCVICIDAKFSCKMITGHATTIRAV